MRLFAVLACGLVAACGPSQSELVHDPFNEVEVADSNAATPPTAEEQAAAIVARAELDAQIARERQLEEIRRRDPAVNWVNIGITTGKFSESIGSSVHRTYEECVARSAMEDNECFPIPALPDSYWNAASVDTLPKGQDSGAGLVRSKGSAVGAEGDETLNLKGSNP